MDTLRVLVVEDISVHRLILTEVLNDIDGVEVVGSASNGKIGLARVEQLRPDLITLDVEMPEMDGIEMLRRLQPAALELGVVMVSVHTARGAEATLQALELGALDFVTKPSGADLRANMDGLRAELKRIIDAYITHRLLRGMSGGKGEKQVAPAPAPAPAVPTWAPVKTTAPVEPIEIVAVGISTGGPNALGVVVPQLPANLRVPVVIVQHMPTAFTSALAASLTSKSDIRVVEGENGLRLEEGTVYIAPGGEQMKVVRQINGGNYLVLTDDPPENHCKPAADYLFRSVAEVYGPRALGVIMTGMGADGREGLKLMKGQGSRVIAQDEESCVVFGMPMEAIKAGIVDRVVPLDNIAGEIVRMVGR
ncbi:MAG: chemotaxis response regulator protein-glutamate methylesterase [Gemmatimonadetes bacterium]|nr:chemotaxis response regulator protein-glutamate methylesterase [Gemmatimonadota bacterium]